MHGRIVTSAPASFKARKKVGACSGARVMMMCFPASGLSALANGSPREAQDFVRACTDENFAEALSQCGGVCRSAARIAADEFPAVGGENRGFDAISPLQMRPCAERNLATALEFMQERAFGGDADARIRVIERGGQARSLGIVRASLNAQSALADCGEHHIFIEHLRDTAR